ncbi:uncharacterized protein LOC144703394 [Wolffia australiana]
MPAEVSAGQAKSGEETREQTRPTGYEPPGSARPNPAPSAKSYERRLLSLVSMAGFFSLRPPHAPLVGCRLDRPEGRRAVFRCSSTSRSPNSSGAPVDDLAVSSPSAEDSSPGRISNGNFESSPMRGCKACGREEIEKGCNGEGRIQGGIATVPGFGWWPIKAYRPCPGFVESGGRYRRRGQSMDEQ